MAYKISMLESYGVNPPETSKPFWGNEEINEDDLVTSIDFKLSFQKLSKKEQTVLSLFYEGYTLREISELSGLPKSTLGDIKDRAVQKMKEMMV